jgi:uncharacterized Fe-S cluster protein YjdI/CDGSH-type Zn-finger protein
VATREYGTDEITVSWESTRCIHTGICLRALPAVFDVQRQPWIDLEAGEAEAIADAVRRCPTGALPYERAGEPEPVPPEKTVVPIPGGPLLLRGRLTMASPDGTALAPETRLALCRCGASENRPYCDNSHRRVGFERPQHHPTDAASPADVAPQQDAEMDVRR